MMFSMGRNIGLCLCLLLQLTKADNVIDVDDILSENYMPGSLLLLESPERSEKLFNTSIVNSGAETFNGTFSEAMSAMGFHRTMMNEYLCRNFVAEQIVHDMSIPRFKKRLGVPVSNAVQPSKIAFAVKKNMLNDEGSTNYKDWLSKSTTLEDIYRHFDADIQKREDDRNNKDEDEDDDEYDKDVTGHISLPPQTPNIPQKDGRHVLPSYTYPGTMYAMHAGQTGVNYGYGGDSGHSGPTQSYGYDSGYSNYAPGYDTGHGAYNLGHDDYGVQSYGHEESHRYSDQSKYHGSDAKGSDLTDLFDIALTALAFLSFGMFLVHVVMCVTTVNNNPTTVVTMMPMSMSPTGPEPAGMPDNGMMGGDDGMTGNGDGDMTGNGSMTGNGGMAGTSEGGDMTGNGGMAGTGNGGDMTGNGGDMTGNGGDMTDNGGDMTENGGDTTGNGGTDMNGNGGMTGTGNGGTDMNGNGDMTSTGNGGSDMNGNDGMTGTGNGGGGTTGNGDTTGTAGGGDMNGMTGNGGMAGDDNDGGDNGMTADGGDGMTGAGDNNGDGDGMTGNGDNGDMTGGGNGGDGVDDGTAGDGDTNTTGNDGGTATGGDADGQRIGIRDGLVFRYKRSIPSITNPDNIALNELARRILTSIEAALIASNDEGACLRKTLCDNNKYSRSLNDKNKIWIPVWSLGMSWLSGRLTTNSSPAASMLDSLKASVLGLGKANCEIIFQDCDLRRETMQRKRRKKRSSK